MQNEQRRPGRALCAIANLLVILAVLAGLFALDLDEGRLVWRAPHPGAFSTFTVLSNLLAAAASAVMLALDVRALARGGEKRPRWAVECKFVAVCAVSVTFWTVLLFLGPAYSYRGQYSDTGFWLHLVAPVLASLGFLFAERGVQLTWWEGLLGAAPVVVYGAVYFERVIISRAWADFYLFNRGGRWPVSMAAMSAASVAIALALRAAYNPRRGKKDAPSPVPAQAQHNEPAR